jgi:carboxypeptidase PM20D1
MFEGSPKDNVLPQRARAVVNFRLYPGDSSEHVLQHIRDAVADPRVEVRALPGSLHEATPESSDKAPAFALIATTIREVFPGALVAPSLNGGAADARQYVHIADNVYRFGPLYLQREDLSRFHGTNERIAISDFARGVVFFEQLIRNADKSP